MGQNQTDSIYLTELREKRTAVNCKFSRLSPLFKAGGTVHTDRVLPDHVKSHALLVSSGGVTTTLEEELLVVWRCRL